jgi:hypothetical protein
MNLYSLWHLNVQPSYSLHFLLTHQNSAKKIKSKDELKSTLRFYFFLYYKTWNIQEDCIRDIASIYTSSFSFLRHKSCRCHKQIIMKLMLWQDKFSTTDCMMMKNIKKSKAKKIHTAKKHLESWVIKMWTFLFHVKLEELREFQDRRSFLENTNSRHFHSKHTSQSTSVVWKWTNSVNCEKMLRHHPFWRVVHSTHQLHSGEC